MKDFLALVGLVALWAIGFGLIVELYYSIKEDIDKLKRHYRYKHRFDKPPTAKCYCIDCK